MEINSLSAAASWLAQMLTDTVATGVALLAVAAFGLSMMQGRIPARRGIGVVLGCFVLFSAATIANALIDSARVPVDVAAVTPAPAPAYRPTAPTPAPYDPYAGASVPSARTAPGGLLQ